MNRVVAVALLVMGVVFAVVLTKRALRANAGTRIPWIGWPDVRPRWSIVLIGLAAGCVAAGTDLLTRRDDGYINVGQASVIWLVGLVALGVPVARHNRRLSRGAGAQS